MLHFIDIGNGLMINIDVFIPSFLLIILIGNLFFILLNFPLLAYAINCSIMLFFLTWFSLTYELYPFYTAKLNFLQSLFYVDYISLVFLAMTLFLFPICVLYASRTLSLSRKLVCLCLISLEILTVLCFTARNLLIFYISFECMLPIMMVLILNFGSRGRKIYAFISFLTYTVFGSIWLVLGIYTIYNDIGFLNIDAFTFQKDISIHTKMLIFLFFTVGFAVKIPTMPMHLWLTEAHVEAPTVGSVILAALLLKLGGYGILRVVLPLTNEVLMSLRFIPSIFFLISSIYAAVLAFRNIDSKKVIAYSSIVHMNLACMALLYESYMSVSGGLFSMLSHSLISSALFFIAGFLYEKLYTRNMLYYSSFFSSLQYLYFFIFVFVLANMAFPGTSSFIGELLVYAGFAQTNVMLLFLSASLIFLTGLFSCVLLYRLIYGDSILVRKILQKIARQTYSINTTYCNIFSLKGVLRFSYTEFFILSLLFLVVVLLFFKPDIFIYNIIQGIYIT